MVANGLKKKLKPDGSIDKYKARLVAKGFKQLEGLEFFDTFSPVTRITSIRLLVAMAAIFLFANSPNGRKNFFSKWRPK